METTYTFRNVPATEAIKKHTQQKLSKLVKYLIKPENAHITLKVEKSRHVAEVILIANGIKHVSSEQSNDLYTSIDQAMKKLEKQVKRYKERIKEHKGA